MRVRIVERSSRSPTFDDILVSVRERVYPRDAWWVRRSVTELCDKLMDLAFDVCETAEAGNREGLVAKLGEALVCLSALDIKTRVPRA